MLVLRVLLIVGTKGVYQTAQIAKTTSKSPPKWYNHIAPQVTVHRNALHLLYILIYFIFLILNILLIV